MAERTKNDSAAAILAGNSVIQLLRVLDNLRLPVCIVTGVKHTIIYANHSIAELWGKDRRFWIGKSFPYPLQDGHCLSELGYCLRLFPAVWKDKEVNVVVLSASSVSGGYNEQRLLELARSRLREYKQRFSTLESKLAALQEVDRERSELAEKLRQAEALLKIYKVRMEAWSSQEKEEEEKESDRIVENRHGLKLDELDDEGLFFRQMEIAIKQSLRYGGQVALLHVDLDRFRILRSALGDSTAEECLRIVAKRIKVLLRKSDMVTREGEDGFLILLSGLQKQEATAMASTVSQRLYEALSRPISIHGHTVQISASVGISVCPGDADNVRQMRDHARLALAMAKELGRGRYQFFTPELQLQHDIRFSIIDGLRTALEQQQLMLLYQPIFSHSGKIVGAEALLRWQHPKRGMLRPDEFLQVAEDTGLVVPIGRWVLATAIEKVGEWRRQGLELFVTVNFSLRQLLQADLGRFIHHCLELSDVPGEALVVEVPEEIYSRENDRLSPLWNDVKDMGVSVAIDNFGEGASKVSLLAKRRMRYIKIDRKYIAGIPSSKECVSVVLAALGLSKTLRVASVAVGVEREQQKDVLCRLGCDFIQGNLWSHPLACEQFFTFVAQCNS